MEKQRPRPWSKIKGIVLIVILGMMSYLLAGFWPYRETATATTAGVERRVNIPYLGAARPENPPPKSFEPAIFWFGQVTPTVNNADVRLWYYDDYVKVAVHIIDRRHWFDKNPSPATMEEWDAVSLLLNLDGNTGGSPTSNAYRFVAQLGSGDEHRVAYKGDGSGWTEISIPYTTDTVYRGQNGPNSGGNAKGWQLTSVIPFSSLGLSERPAGGTEWGLSVVVHDRDEADGIPVIADQVWPELADTDVPATWGVMNFGIPAYDHPPAVPQGTTTIRHGLNGAEVIDGHVGGHTICGKDLDHWREWGEANYAGITPINIQNQWDISDYPCFSKYFVTFPLDALPAVKTILDGSLSMHLSGNAGGGDWGMPPDSFVQVATVAEDWDEQTLNWNNAPRALENIGGTWVEPVQVAGPRSYSWDVSRAVADAYQKGEPLRLALYSSGCSGDWCDDGERHSGKYFRSSDGVAPARAPSLQVVWGDPCDDPGVECHFTYLPAISG